MIGTDLLVWLFKEIIYLAGTGSVIFFLLLILKKIFRKALSPKWHYYIWILLLIRLLVPFEPESPLSIYNVITSAVEKINLPIGEMFTRMQTSLPGTAIQDEITVNTQLSHNQTQYENGKNPSGNTIPYADIDDNGVYHSESGFILRIASICWLGGIILLTVYIIYINSAFTINVRRNYTPLNDIRIEGILKSCRTILGIQRELPVLTSKKMRTPSLYGLINPCILVSEYYMKQLSDDEIRYIFLHELSHYKRKDIAVNWLLTSLQIIYFFNPLIWYAFYKIHEDCEIACDAEALKYLEVEEYQPYGNTIIKLIRLFSESHFIPTTAGISKNKSGYKRRIIMITKFKKSNWTGTVLAVFIIIVAAIVGLTGCTTIKETQQGRTSSETSQESTPTPDTSTEPSPSPTDSVKDTDASDNSSSQEPSDTSEQKGYYGQWVINGVLAYGAAGTYSSEDAEKLIGTSLSFSTSEAIIINDQPSDLTSSIKNPEYQETTISADDFIMNFRMTFDKLGITTDSVTEIIIGGSDETAGCTLLLKDNSTVILIAGGTYFALMKP